MLLIGSADLCDSSRSAPTESRLASARAWDSKIGCRRGMLHTEPAGRVGCERRLALIGTPLRWLGIAGK
jgi:hypothetical protein